MASEIVMPQMGAEMEEGTVVRWLKQPGDHVARGETIAEIETDKATVDLEAFEEGYFLGSTVELGQTVPVGTVIGYLGALGEQLPARVAGAAPTPAATSPSPSEAAPVPATALARPAVGADSQEPSNGYRAAIPPSALLPGGRLRASPLARSIAEELGIDLTRVRGSGPEGRIMRRDVEEFARAQREAAAGPAPSLLPPVAPAATLAATGEVVPLTRMRQATARRMAAAKREIPHYYLTTSVDMVEALALRAQINAALAEHERVSINDLVVKACALALEKHPEFNATFTEEGVRRFEAINIGIAVALEDGLVAPAVLNCRGKSLGAIAREARDLAERARAGHLRPAELAEGTFTVSNLGMYGVETLIAVIQPGQSAILGVGKVEPRAVVREGTVVARDTMTIALAADHRATDGAQGARFLAEIKALLEQPIRLAL